ncbi:MAG: hypothetical protein VB014_10300 [Acidaminococcaceae bacterium]|nr:hypothetical protein [Acidaminococcaceae bacterium]
MAALAGQALAALALTRNILAGSALTSLTIRTVSAVIYIGRISLQPVYRRP